MNSRKKKLQNELSEEKIERWVSAIKQQTIGMKPKDIQRRSFSCPVNLMEEVSRRLKGITIVAR